MLYSNISIRSTAGKELLADLHYPENSAAAPIAVFFHGFKGFKDWGFWALAGNALAAAGVAFLRCNFSHNGVTPEQLQDFADLEAFGQNSYSKELADITAVLDWLHQPATQQRYPLDLNRLTLIGHSRGGGISIIAASEDARIQQLITWASVDGLDFLWRNQSHALLNQWRAQGVYYIHNARTGQQMPLYFQLYEDFERNADRFDIQAALRDFSKPMLILHGSADTSVPPEAARRLKAWNPAAELRIIDGGDHVFGGKHPYLETELPGTAEELVEVSLRFVNRTK